MMDVALENTRRLMNEALAKAKKAHRLNQSGLRRLKSWPLWIRVLSYGKFRRLRKRIKNHEWTRFACTTTALHLARSIKFYERRLRQRQSENT